MIDPDSEYDQLTKTAEFTIRDIFKKYDLLGGRDLSYDEFSAFYTTLGYTLTEEDFNTNLLGPYNSTATGLTINGFLNFFQDSIKKFGEVEMI